MSPLHPYASIALLPWGDRFEDFFDKIGLSLESFRHELTGGWLFNYVEALGLAGISTVLIFASARVDAPKQFRHEPTGATVIVLPSPRLHQKARGARERYGWRSPSMRAVESYLATPAARVATVLRRKGCRAILCQEYEQPGFDVSVAIGRFLGLPVFGTYQGGVGGFSWPERATRRLAMRGAAGLIVPAQAEAERVRTAYPRIPVASIPNPLDVERWQPLDRRQARQRLGLPPTERIAVWHGRTQIDKKGLDVLISAWDRLTAGSTDTRPRLLLIGTGTDAPELARRIAASPGRDTITWVDEYVRDRDRLWTYLSAADLYVLPSRREGFPVAAVEAMACGLPVVASDVPGVVDVVGDGVAGVLVPAGDADPLAAAVAGMLADPGATAVMGRMARSVAEQRYSLSAVGAALVAFLRRHGMEADR